MKKYGESEFMVIKGYCGSKFFTVQKIKFQIRKTGGKNDDFKV